MTETKPHLRQPHLERLTPLDVSNLRTEYHGMPMHVAALALIDGASVCDESGRLREAVSPCHRPCQNPAMCPALTCATWSGACGPRGQQQHARGHQHNERH